MATHPDGTGQAEAAMVEARADPRGMPPRLDAVDLLRGLVMVLMVLDHTRDFFADTRVNPVDLARTTPALFLTRWVTHFCAPVFAFLAGTGARLAGLRGKARGDLAWFLATRGCWLIVLEATVEKFGLMFRPDPAFYLAVVLWSIGGSFVLVAGLVALGVPGRAIGALGVLVIASHNLLDGAGGPAAGANPLLVLLRQPGLLRLPGGVTVLVGYPLIPWFGVVAAGYGFGEVFGQGRREARRVIFAFGVGLTAAFVLLRAANGYGDPTPWSVQRTPLLTVLSFLNCTKYPPSLLFVLMTLGPALLVLAACVAGTPAPARPLVTLGRVPLFFYLLQWYVIHALAWLAAWVQGQPTDWLFPRDAPPQPPPACAYSLGAVYVWWLVVLALLYGPCSWFAGIRRRHPGVRWLSYL